MVLGLSMAPSAIRMVLVEGENADGVTVDEDHFAVNVGSHPAALSGPDQLIAAVLGTREGATEAGYRLTSIGVTWTDPGDAAALATALAARKIENVMLVSAFLAAAALAQTVGNAIGYEYIAMLFVEPDTATIAVIDSADGSVNDVYRRSLQSADPVSELIAMIAGLNDPDAYPEGLFIVGCDVDIAPIKPVLEAASLLPVSAPEEPDMALARGAALASASAPLFASSTAALAYAQDPGTGAVDRYAVSPGYLEMPGSPINSGFGNANFAYSAAPDDQADAYTGVVDIANTATAHELEASPRRRPLLLAGSALAAIVVSAALALEIALALGIRPAVALRPSPGRVLVAPVQQAPSLPVPQLLPAPQPQTVHLPGRIADAGSRTDRSCCAGARTDSRRTAASAGSRAVAHGDSRAVLSHPIWPVGAATQSRQSATALTGFAVAVAVPGVAVAGADARAVSRVSVARADARAVTGADARAVRSGARAVPAARRIRAPSADELRAA